MSKRTMPEVNAGSMADIAFLLLIFFLVSTTIQKDMGIARLLPEEIIDKPIVDIKHKNLFEVGINKHDELFVENNLMDLKDLRQATIDFVDNGGAVAESNEYCNHILSSIYTYLKLYGYAWFYFKLLEKYASCGFLIISYKVYNLSNLLQQRYQYI